MRGLLLAILVLVAASALAGPAQAATQVASGNKPNAVTDREGTTHLVWNQDVNSGKDVMHYCRIPRGALKCADERTFVPFPAYDAIDNDFHGPRVFITRFGEVVLLTHRCCENREGGDRSVNVIYVSGDDGDTFGARQTIGRTPFGFGGDPGSAILDAVDRRMVTIDWRTGGIFLQGASLDAYTSGEARLFDGDAVNPSAVQRGRGAFTAAFNDLDSVVHLRTFDCDGCPLSTINDASKWTAGQTLPEAELPQLSTGPSGTFVAYRSTAQATNRQWRIRRVEGGSFGPAREITPPGASGPFHSLLQDETGRLHFGATDRDASFNYRSSADGATFTPPTTLQAEDFSIAHLTLSVGTGDQGFTGVGFWESQDGGQANPPIFAAALPAPSSGAPPPPPPPPPAPPPPPGAPPKPPAGGLPSPVGPGQLAACRVLQFAALDVVADACMKVENGVYVATGGVAVNGLRVKLAPGGELRLDPKARTVTSSGQVELILGRTVLVRDRIGWKLPAGNTVDLGDLDVGVLGGKLLGFPLAGKASLRLRRGGAELGVNLGLPKLFGGVSGAVTVRADNATGVYIRDLEVAVGNALIGPLQIKDLTFAYDADEDTWQGAADLILPPQPPGPSLESEIGFREGGLDYLRAQLTLPGNGLPLEPFGVVYLRKIRFAMSTSPLKLGGGLTVTAGPTIAGVSALAMNGDFSFTFPDPPKPAILRVDGSLAIVDIDLARAYFEFRTNGYVGFGGRFDLGDPDIFSIGAGFNGWLYRSAFNVSANGSACVGLFGCAEAEVVVSSVGLGACTKGDLSVGGGYRWGESIDVMLSGCDIGEYSATIAQAGGARAVRFKSGLPSGFVAVTGRDAPPHVTLVGPNGQRIEAPVGSALKTDAAIAFAIPKKRTTYFGIVKPAAGEWRVETRQGSPAVASVSAAEGVEDPSIRARVRRRGSRRVLEYDVAPRPGQKVTFAEEGAAAAAAIGTARGRRGRLTFRPTEGPGGRRKIIAMVESFGIPRASTTVGSYVAPAPRRPGRARSFKAARRGSRLAVSWRPGTGARRQVVRVTLSDGRRHVFPLGARVRRLSIPALDAADTGRVSVTALRADGSAGPAATARLRPKPRARRR